MEPTYNAPLWLKIKAAGTNQEKVAASIGVDAPTMSDYINGRRWPTEDQAHAVARLLRCRVDEIFEHVRTKRPLTKALEAQRMNLHGLHLKTGIAISKLRAFELAHQHPNDSERGRIAAALNTSADVLFGRDITK